MAEPDRERLDALSEALARLVRAQRENERRLARIELALGLFETPAPQPAAPPYLLPPEPEPVPAGPPISEAVPAMAAEAAPPPAPESGASAETRMGLTWVNRIGVVTFVLGVLFFFKYAVDNQWIGETGRVALGVLAGLALLAAADALWRRGQRVFAQGITGAGIAVLYVAFYAAFGFYRLVPQPAAFLLMLLNTAAAGVLALRYGSAAIAALGLLGGYLTPILLSRGADAPWFFLGYVLVLGLGAAWVSQLRGWRSPDHLALFATFFLYMAWFSDRYADEKRLVATVFPLAYFALFLTRRWLLVAALAPVAALIELAAVSGRDPHPFLTLAPLVLGAGLLVAGRRGANWMAGPLAGAFWLCYGVLHAGLQRNHSHGSILALLALSFLAIQLWPPLSVALGRPTAGLWGLLAAAFNAACFFSAGFDLLDGAGLALSPGMLGLLLAAGHFGLAWWAWRTAPAEGRRPDLGVLLYLGIALTCLTLAIPLELTGYRVTMAWALEAAALAWIAGRTRDLRLAWAATAVAAIAFVRLALEDSVLRAAVALVNLRFLTFVVAAVAFGLMAWWLRWRKESVVAYVAAHFVLLWGLVLETWDWAGRAAAAGELASLRSAAASLVLAGYAVALVAAGFVSRSALNRMIGLALIGVVVLKLYLYDVWLFDRGIYRIIAFAGLGALLLLMSYLYSRYRATLEAFWRDEPPRG